MFVVNYRLITGTFRQTFHHFKSNIFSIRHGEMFRNASIVVPLTPISSGGRYNSQVRILCWVKKYSFSNAFRNAIIFSSFAIKSANSFRSPLQKWARSFRNNSALAINFSFIFYLLERNKACTPTKAGTPRCIINGDGVTVLLPKGNDAEHAPVLILSKAGLDLSQWYGFLASNQS